MITFDFQGTKLSRLGFGTMRLPMKNGEIDQEQVERMVDLAISKGVNYFDTAYPYHGGKSEISIGKALKKYPRESFFLADKYPGHQLASSYDPKKVFEDQLKKCGVDYFDFYLLHNVHESDIHVYESEKWNIIPYFLEQKRLGRIKHLGFSSHAYPDVLNDFLNRHPDTFEFVLLECNYLDWTIQDAKRKNEILKAHHLPMWVMEPVRGGKLASTTEENQKVLDSFRPNVSTASWAFRFLQDIDNVGVILSGMSSYEQMEDNLKTFEERKPLSDQERDFLFHIADGLKNNIPCTACRYCIEGCPKHLDIPRILALYNECRVDKTLTVSMSVDGLNNHQPKDCIACGKCKLVCPQKIDIPTHMKEFADVVAQLPHWSDICKQREEAQKKLDAESKKNSK